MSYFSCFREFPLVSPYGNVWGMPFHCGSSCMTLATWSVTGQLRYGDGVCIPCLLGEEGQTTLCYLTVRKSLKSQNYLRVVLAVDNNIFSKFLEALSVYPNTLSLSLSYGYDMFLKIHKPSCILVLYLFSWLALFCNC